MADVTITPIIKVEQAAFADAQSRCRMAQAARDQIADELTQAEREVAEAEAAVTAAAEAVIVAEVEAACSLAAINAAVAELIEADDAIFGLVRLWGRGGDAKLTPRLREAVGRLQGLRLAIGALRPPQPVLAPPAEHRTMMRFEAYRERLTRDPEVKLADIPMPAIEIARVGPPAGAVNVIEQDRERAARAWARAVG